MSPRRRVWRVFRGGNVGRDQRLQPIGRRVLFPDCKAGGNLIPRGESTQGVEPSSVGRPEIARDLEENKVRGRTLQPQTESITLRSVGPPLLRSRQRHRKRRILLEY